nr:unnamed protein product [Callosobruchus analis]
MKEDNPAKGIWEEKLFGKRKRGRPKKTWDTVIHKILEKRGTTWRDAKKLAQNKKHWNQWMYHRTLMVLRWNRLKHRTAVFARASRSITRVRLPHRWELCAKMEASY